MKHWDVISEEMPEMAREGDRIIYVLVMDDLESAYFELRDNEEVEKDWLDLSEEEKARLFKAADKACDHIEWVPTLQEAIKEELKNAERDG